MGVIGMVKTVLMPHTTLPGPPVFTEAVVSSSTIVNSSYLEPEVFLRCHRSSLGKCDGASIGGEDASRGNP